jgi:hypothetical protein
VAQLDVPHLVSEYAGQLVHAAGILDEGAGDVDVPAGAYTWPSLYILIALL